ncbi:MAG: monofunctional biosynthetic peptidoglycan transglycosylase [Bacteroidota bacterium]
MKYLVTYSCYSPLSIPSTLPMSTDYSSHYVDYPAQEAPQKSKFPIFRIGLRVVAISLILFFLLSVFWVLVYRFTDPPSSFIMRRDQQKGLEIDRRPVTIDQISPHLPLAVLAAEDQQFCVHNGFDWTAIAKAQAHNEEATIKRGASTLSMQTAKNAFLWPTRSWIRKGFEAYFTALIEILWPKERILEVYLNLAEWGFGIYGAEAASHHYFGKSASQLTLHESALLAAALPTPTRSNPSSPTAYLTDRAAFIEADMARIGGDYGNCLTP